MQNPKARVMQDDGRSRLVEAKSLGKVPDVLKVSSLLEWAGVSFGTDIDVY